jgi:hypothetical protein
MNRLSPLRAVVRLLLLLLFSTKPMTTIEITITEIRPIAPNFLLSMPLDFV